MSDDSFPLSEIQDPVDPLDRIQARRYLSEVNRFLLQNEGEIREAPGKLSLIWTDPIFDLKRYLSVKAAGDDQILVNGKRYPATEASLQQALLLCMKEYH